MPLHRQIPKKRGFTSRHPKHQVLDLDQIERKFNAGEVISPKTAFDKGLIKYPEIPVKVLAEGKLSKALTFEKVRVSRSAREKIEQAGGKINV